MRNETFNSTSHKAKNKRRDTKIKSYFIIVISETPEKLSLFTLVTNYHKLLLLPLVVKP